MKSRINWRYVLIAFLVVIGINGLVRAVPRAKESGSDLLIDAAVLIGIAGVSLLIARLRERRQRIRGQQVRTQSGR